MSEWKIRFGTAGTSDSFTAMGYKNSLDIPAYTEKMGLDAFESVSYTHLDVYKRQAPWRPPMSCTA